MRRFLFPVALLLGVVLAWRSSAAVGGDGLIAHPEAARHGLSRAWFTQVQLDQARARLAHAVLHHGTLFVQTDQAVLHAIDGETGQTLWAEQVGNRNHPSTVPAANDDVVAVINGIRLYVLNRYNGRLLWQTLVDGAPGAGPALSSQRAYVPTVSGLVYSYRLKPVQSPLKELGKTGPKTAQEEAEERAERREAFRLAQAYIPPLACQSTGRALVQPLVARQNPGEEFLAWSTDRGYLYIGRIDRSDETRFTTRYRLQTNAEIVAQPSYLPPDPDVVGDSGVIYAVSKDGFVHAIRERDGASLWRFSTGEPIVQPAVVIGQHVYAATQPGGMYCLEAKSGKQVWWTPQAVQFVAASKDRVYASDKQGQMLILDAKSGARTATVTATAPLLKLVNAESDRIYLATETGLLQCLHETELSEPIRHLRIDKDVEATGATEATEAVAVPAEEGAKPAEERKPVLGGGGGGGGGGGFRPTVKKPARKPKPAAGMEDEGFGMPGQRAKTARNRRAGAAGSFPGMEDAMSGDAQPGARPKPKPRR